MAIVAQRTETVQFTGDMNYVQQIQAAVNNASPGMIDNFTLSAGNTIITVPSVACKAAIIIPPSGNVQTIFLKGIAGDAGVPISKLDPTTIAFDSPASANFVLSCGGIITNLRIIWV